MRTRPPCDEAFKGPPESGKNSGLPSPDFFWWPFRFPQPHRTNPSERVALGCPGARSSVCDDAMIQMASYIVRWTTLARRRAAVGRGPADSARPVYAARGATLKFLCQRQMAVQQRPGDYGNQTELGGGKSKGQTSAGGT